LAGRIGCTHRVQRVDGAMAQTRLPFELDVRAEAGTLTAYGGVPLLIEAFRTSGATAMVDEQVSIKRRKRGLLPSQLVEGLFSL
jgi:hypothetical protein